MLTWIARISLALCIGCFSNFAAGEWFSDTGLQAYEDCELDLENADGVEDCALDVEVAEETREIPAYTVMVSKPPVVEDYPIQLLHRNQYRRCYLWTE